MQFQQGRRESVTNSASHSMAVLALEVYPLLSFGVVNRADAGTPQTYNILKYNPLEEFVYTECGHLTLSCPPSDTSSGTLLLSNGDTFDALIKSRAGFPYSLQIIKVSSPLFSSPILS